MPLEAPVISATLFSSLTIVFSLSSGLLLSSDPFEIPPAFPIRHRAVESILFGLEEMRIVRCRLCPKCSLCEVTIREMLNSISQRPGDPVRFGCSIKITRDGFRRLDLFDNPIESRSQSR